MCHAGDYLCNLIALGKIVCVHKLLTKHESAALIQMRVEKIGLRGFLFSSNVCTLPIVESPIDDHYHVILHCPTFAHLQAASHPPVAPLRDRRDMDGLGVWTARSLHHW